MPSEEIHSYIPKPSTISLLALESQLTTYSVRPHGAQKKRISKCLHKCLLSVKFVSWTNLKQINLVIWHLYIKLDGTTVKREQL